MRKYVSWYFHGMTIVSCLQGTLRQRFTASFSAHGVIPAFELSMKGKQQLSHNPGIKRNFK